MIVEFMIKTRIGADTDLFFKYRFPEAEGNVFVGNGSERFFCRARGR